jgi:hypothetical protein
MALSVGDITTYGYDAMDAYVLPNTSRAAAQGLAMTKSTILCKREACVVPEELVIPSPPAVGPFFSVPAIQWPNIGQKAGTSGKPGHVSWFFCVAKKGDM